MDDHRLCTVNLESFVVKQNNLQSMVVVKVNPMKTRELSTLTWNGIIPMESFQNENLS